MLTPEIQSKVDAYLAAAYDDGAKAEIRDLQARGEDEALTDAFYRTLEFGTGGLRGIMGAGLNRMNRYTLGAATQGLCNYLHQSFVGERIRVAIAHDSRLNSAAFARVAADVFSANGIDVFLFDALRPTPELSFAIRHLGCHSGAVITASHNPKEYNGYKIYWQDGAQVTPPHDKAIIEEVNAIQSLDAIKFEGDETRIHAIGADVDEAYLQMLQSLSVKPEVVDQQGAHLKIVYTPIHGTGITLVPSALKRFGFQHVRIVEAQATPDGNFPTVHSPNPEEKPAMQLALDMAQAEDADLVLATDPDADRVGAGIKNEKGEWVLLNGNQTAALLVYYLLTSWRDAGRLTGREYICNTIVTTDLINEMAAALGVPCHLTLTGFKYIAQVIREREKLGEVYICGGEESYGFLIGQQVRDKDAVAACCLIAELAAVMKDQGKTLQDALVAMYTEFGYRKEDLISLTKKGQRGTEEIKEMMQGLRANPPASIGGSPVVTVLDYLTGESNDLSTGVKAKLEGYDQSDVLQFLTADGTKVSARPSGTEPKIKFYFSVRADLASAADYERAGKELNAKIQGIMTEMGLR
ncbi:MAG: phospho-sugar mutase [Hymenobacteraceae bacterium]|nr:phospho-sugar mutase [Hymenobacteraceae bacterium]